MLKRTEDDNDEDEPLFQLWTDNCLVICRLSSWSSAKKYGGGQAANNRVVTERQTDGVELIRRLERNSSALFRFQRTESLCFMRHSTELTVYNKKKGKVSAMARGIRDWVREQLPSHSKLTLLVRGIDGISCCRHSLLSFVEMLHEAKVSGQLLFQYNKVCDR